MTRAVSAVVIVTLSVAAVACGKLMPKSSGKGGSGSSGNSEASGTTTLVLRPPALAQFPPALQPALTGFELKLTPIDCKAGGTGLSAMQAWTGKALQLNLASECDYSVLVNLGRLGADGLTLSEIYYTTTDALGAASRIDAGRLDPGATLTLRVAFRTTAGGASTTLEASPEIGDAGTLRAPGAADATQPATATGTGTAIGTGTGTGTGTATDITFTP